MKWIKWLFSLMHIRFWIAFTGVPIGLLSVWLAPGAAATTTLGIILGLLWYIAIPLSCIISFFYLVSMQEHHWDRWMRNWKEFFQEKRDTFQSIIDYFSNWWNSRPKPE